MPLIVSPRLHLFGILVAVAWLASMGCSQSPVKVGSPPGPASVKRLDDQMDLLPPKWAVLRVKTEPVEKFFMRLPKVQGWFKKLDALEKSAPPDELEAERLKMHEGAEPEFAVACSAKTLVKLFVQSVAPFPMAGPAHDLQAMVRQIEDLELHRKILNGPTEMVNLSTKAQAFDLGKNMPSAGEVDKVGTTPIYRFDLDFFAEPRPGALIGGSHLHAIKQSLREAAAGRKRSLPSFEHDVLLHLPPEFLDDEIWSKLFKQDFLHEKGKLNMGNVWLGARVVPDGLRIHFQAEIEDGALLEKARKTVNAVPPKEEPKPFVKNSEVRLDGKTLHAMMDVEDGFVDQLLPTAEQIGQWLGFADAMRKALHRK